MVKTLGKYEFHRTLGEGSFGKCVHPTLEGFMFVCFNHSFFFQSRRVKYAVNIETNEAVAIKVLDKVR